MPNNTSNQDSSQDWTFKTEEEIAAEAAVLKLSPTEADYFSISQGENKPVMNLSQNLVMSFHKEGKDIAHLDWSDGKMKFDGDADAAAKIFFDCVKFYIDSHIDSRVHNVVYEIDKHLEQFK